MPFGYTPTGLLGTYLGNIRRPGSNWAKAARAITGLPSLLGQTMADPRFQDVIDRLAVSEQRAPADDVYYRAKAREAYEAAKTDRATREAAGTQAGFIQPILDRNAALRQQVAARERQALEPFIQRTAAQQTAADRGLLGHQLETPLGAAAFRSAMPPLAQPSPDMRGLFHKDMTPQEIALTSGVSGGAVEPLAHQTPQHLTHVGMLPAENPPRRSQQEYLAMLPEHQAILAGLTSPDEVAVRQSMDALSKLPARISTEGQKTAWNMGLTPDDPEFTRIAQSIDAPIRPFESTEERLTAEDYHNLYINIRDGLYKTREAVKQLEQIDDIFSKTYTGPGGEALNTFKRVASIFFPGDDFLEREVTAADAARALGNKLTLQMRNTGEGAGMPGQMSDKDREFLAQMVPNLSMTPGGRKILIKVYKKMRDLFEERFERASIYKANNNNVLDAGFDRQEHEIQKQLQASGKHIFQTGNVHFADEAAAENIPKKQPTASGAISQAMKNRGSRAFGAAKITP
jgi:hypothetical protein